MIAGLCESPLTFQAIIIWRDELDDGKVLLRDIIDLEATYAGPEGKGAPKADGRGRGAERRAGAAEADGAEPPIPEGRPRRRRHGEQRVALGHGSRAEAEGSRDLRPHRRRLQEAAPPAGPERRDQAAEHDAVAGPGAQVQEAQGRDRHRREVAVAQPEPHRGAGRAALRHQQAPDRPRGPPAAAGRELPRVAREDFLKNYQGSELDPKWVLRVSKLGTKGWKEFVAHDKDAHQGHPRRRSTRSRPRRAWRSPNSARSCTWCRRASARPGRPRRKWSRPTCAS